MPTIMDYLLNTRQDVIFALKRNADSLQVIRLTGNSETVLASERIYAGVKY